MARHAGRGAADGALREVSFQNADRRFVTLGGKMMRLRQSLGREITQQELLRGFDRLNPVGGGQRVQMEPWVYEGLLGGARHAAKVRTARASNDVVNRTPPRSRRDDRCWLLVGG